MFIRATGNISPQNTFGHQLGQSLFQEQKGNRLRCMEPDYKEFIDPKLIRRMSRVIKMGVTAASACLKEAGIEMPDAIITGTAYGCLEDTGLFLSRMVDQKEELLTPTAFIQSTHNTVGAQIALMLHCHQYNNTIVHRGFSFENALLDAILLLEEHPGFFVMVGGVDEITDTSHQILSRFGLYKPEKSLNSLLMGSGTKGTIAGEGASFFLLTDQESEKNWAKLDGMSTYYKPANFDEIKNEIFSFLGQQQIGMDEIDLIILGRNGDEVYDEVYDQLEASIFNKSACVNYKHLCGEYPTANAFALWLAARIVKTNQLPEMLSGNKPSNNKFKKVLVYNHYQNIHHSLLLVSAC
ncbi:MAG: beta-ketoacyl synthase chain length factor [Bacteroidetes bacterium]|nr:beta-ketoacyl synthase chain length factor [Bacteroidota bacterium]